MNMDLLHMESIIKLLVAMLFGLFIGIDRQLKQKPLGIRTSMVISIASCLVTLVSIHAYDKFGGPEHPNMDPMRLAAQIVSGIGFWGGCYSAQRRRCHLRADLGGADLDGFRYRDRGRCGLLCRGGLRGYTAYVRR